MIESLRSRLGAFIERRHQEMLQSRKRLISRLLVISVREKLGISLVDHDKLYIYDPKNEYLMLGDLVMEVHNHFRTVVQSDYSLPKPGRKFNIYDSLNAIVGIFELWRDQTASLTAEQFTAKIAPESEPMRRLLTKLRYAPEGRSYLARLKGESKNGS